MIRSFLGGHLSEKLTQNEMRKLFKSIDIIGDIAIVKVPSELGRKKQIIAEEVMTINGNVKTVLNQVSPVTGEYRLRKFEWIMGEKKTKTIYREHGCAFEVDLSEVYFSPRLSFERMRIARLVREGEVVINMFAGVGSFSIITAKYSKAKTVYSIDINQIAVELMMRNIVLNRLEGKVHAILGDAKEVVEKRFRCISNRVLMPLPAKAYEYLDAACLALRSEGGCIHYYDFVYARKKEEAIRKIVEKVGERLASLGRDFEVIFARVVRTIGPNWNQVVLDINLL